MTYKMLIDGRLVDGAGQFDVVNPATDTAFAQAPHADGAQLDLAVDAAKRAFPAWSALTYGERGQYLTHLADAVEARFEEFAALLTREQGKPLAQARGEIFGAIRTVRSHAEMTVPTRTLREDATSRVIEHYTPLGVVAAITPWNFPMLLFAQKIAPALVTGNTVVGKPAATTPLTTLLLGEVAASILPAGVLNIIADRNDLGEALTTHPDVAKISFTGSSATGRKVFRNAGDALKRLTLELGGNDAAIILDDVDPEEVAPAIFAGATYNAGQVCMAVKRVYAPSSIYDRLCDALARLAKDAVVDDGANQGAEIGPIQNRAQFEKLKGYLREAHECGTVIAGGEVLDREGYFVQPTIVRDIADSARLVCEEQFGPILPVLRYDDIDDAIARANDSEYGLAGTVWTRDIDRGTDVAMKIDTGTVWVNKHLDIAPDTPFGGVKQSGFGRENGQEGLEAYTQAKIVNIALA